MASFKNVNNSLKLALRKATSPANMRKLAKMASDMIRTRTRLGFGVKTLGGKRQKLAPLKPSTKKSRKANPNLSGLTSAGKSNLTETGQLLDSIDVVSVTQGKAVVSTSGSRKGGGQNKEIAGYVSVARPFMNISDVEIKRIEDDFSKIVEKELDGELNKIK